MKQGKIEIIQKTGKTYEYTNEKGKIKYILYNIKISPYPDMVNYSYPIDKELSFKENDIIEFEYNQLKNKITKVQKVKQSMYSNYTKQEQSVARLDTGRSILLQVAFKEASQAYIAGKISQDEVGLLTNKYFNIIDK